MKRSIVLLIALFYVWCGFTERALAQSAEPQTGEATSPEAATHRFFEPKAGKDVTFYTPGGELTFYGYLDVSFDVTTKGISDLRDSNGNGPVGHVGWMPALSTNLSYLGARGFVRIAEPLRFVWQLETQIDITVSSGISETSSNKSNVVRGGLTYRDTFVGLSTPWGSLKLGKTHTPYRNSTIRMNPFSGMIGDYAVVMGNTGGDNRVEFGTRLENSIWYESPKFYGFSLSVLYSPGQNRGIESDNIPAGAPDCRGGNIPGSGGTGTPGGFPISCNDGGFGDALSASISYEYASGDWDFYVTGAYERHWAVNRNSDIYGIYGSFPLPAAVGNYDTLDVADEDAYRIGAQVVFPTRTTLGGFFEYFHRYVPQELQFQNERQRPGFWVTASQWLSKADSLHLGWAHAFKTPGDPGQHNTALADVGNGGFAGGTDADNSADMLTAALKHNFGHEILVYLAWAYTINAKYAHYDLGAGGRGVTTDCHDGGLPASGDVNSSPHCWAGGKLMGVSLGMSARF